MTMPELMEIADGIPYKADASQGTRWAFGQLFQGGVWKWKKYRLINGTDFAVHHLFWLTYVRRYLAKHEPEIYKDRVETNEVLVFRLNKLKCIAVFVDKNKGPRIIHSHGLPPVE